MTIQSLSGLFIDRPELTMKFQHYWEYLFPSGALEENLQELEFSLRKLEKAVAVCGMRSGVPEENSGKVPGKLLEKCSRIAKYYKF